VTALELISTIKAVGGTVELSADGERVRCKLPRGADALRERIVHHRIEILEALRDCGTPIANDPRTQHASGEFLDAQWNEVIFAGSLPGEIPVISVTEVTKTGVDMAALGQLTRQWLTENCTASTRGVSSLHGLHRHFCRWAGVTSSSDTRHAFLTELQRLGFFVDQEMIVDIVLSDDFLTALTHENPQQTSRQGIAGTHTTNTTEANMRVTYKPKEYERPSEGIHQAVVADVVDLGLKEDKYSKNEKKKVQMVQILFLVDQLDSTGRHIAVRGQPCSLKAHPGSTLRKMYKLLKGKDPGNDLETDDLLGDNIRILIVHKESDDGRIFANIGGYLKLRKGDAPLAVPSDFVRAKDRNREPDGNGGVPVSNVQPTGGNGIGRTASKSATRDKKMSDSAETKTTATNSHGDDVTDADVQFPEDEEDEE
jgi:hypothetical protein